MPKYILFFLSLLLMSQSFAAELKSTMSLAGNASLPLAIQKIIIEKKTKNPESLPQSKKDSGIKKAVTIPKHIPKPPK